MPEPNLSHFEAFIEVADCGGFTQAARKLNRSKAAISHSIHVLEQSLQLPLFKRDTRNIALTDEGALLLAQCRKLQEELIQTKALVSQFHTQPAGQLKLSCNPYLFEKLLFKTIKDYMLRFPEVALEVYSEERMPDMFKESYDIVCGINWPCPDDVVAKKIDKTRYVLCASPEYLAQYGTPKSIAELSTHRYIPHLGRGQDKFITNTKKPYKLTISPQLKLNNAFFMKQCALDSLGIVQLHEYMVSQELKQGCLIEVLKEALQPEIPIFVYYQKHRFVQPKIRQFINLLPPFKG